MVAWTLEGHHVSFIYLFFKATLGHLLFFSVMLLYLLSFREFSAQSNPKRWKYE